MKTIDLGEKEQVMEATAAKPKEPRIWYPSVHFSDNGIGGVSSFDDSDIGKTIRVTATIKLKGIRSRADEKIKGKKFEYDFEVHKIEMPDDLSRQEDTLKSRQVDRNKKKGMV
jgi:hypothetical protein